MIAKPVYESLPVLYVGGALLAAAANPSPAMLFPSALLLLAGIAVIYLRFSYRFARTRR